MVRLQAWSCGSRPWTVGQRHAPAPAAAAVPVTGTENLRCSATLCDLIAHAAVVYLDETGWKVGSTGCSLWAFASNWHRVFLFGCHKEEATLDTILPLQGYQGRRRWSTVARR